MKRSLYFLIASLSLILVIANIIVSASYATTGQRLKQLEQQKHELAETSRLLRQDILSATAISKLETHAQQAGFESPQEFITVIDPTAPVALSASE